MAVFDLKSENKVAKISKIIQPIVGHNREETRFESQAMNNNTTS